MKTAIKVLIFFSLVFQCCSALAQETTTEGVYEKHQDELIDYFGGIQTAVANLPDKPLETIPPLEIDHIHNLTAVALYCTIKRGACPFLLQAIREVEVINSTLAGRATCPNMVAFWKRWIKNGFEDRVNYNISTGHLKKYIEFKNNQRKEFIHCSKTTAALLKDAPDDFLEKRYAKGSPESEAIATTVLYMKGLRDRQINTFVATGAYKR